MGKNEELNMEKTIKTTCEILLLQMRKKGLVKDNKSAFQKTEQLLYNYNSFKAAVQDKRDQISELKQRGLPEKSKSITFYTTNGRPTTDPLSDKIESIELSIRITESSIKTIDAALDKVKDDLYYKIIEMKYFKGESQEDIAKALNVDASTIARNKTRLLNNIKIHLFTDESIFEMFC